MPGENKITVLDFGSQYTQLIARRIRKLGVFSEILQSETPAGRLEGKGVILSGGPASVYEPQAPKYDPGLFNLGIPVLGICYGMQVMAKELGGVVSAGKIKEYGKTEIRLKKGHLFSGLEEQQTVWMSHGDAVSKLPSGFKVDALTKDGLTAAVSSKERKLYAVQFHPEVTHTPDGIKMLKNFIFGICGCRPDWTMGNFISRKKEEIRAEVGDRNVLVLVSGGVDSAVTAALLSKVIDKEKLYALYIDTGLMRKGETGSVRRMLESLDLKHLRMADHSRDFLSALKGVSSPEQKRRIIGDLFIGLQQKEIEKLGLQDYLLAQGTLYTDLIESGKGVGNKADKIKSHHNVASQLVERLRAEGRLIEPLNGIFKDEVREAGSLLGLPEEIIRRHPFPGPALAVRMVCGASESSAAQETAEKVRSISKRYDLTGHLTPVKTVGVQGDQRTYRNLVLLEGESDWSSMKSAAEEMVRKLKTVNRVAYIVKSRLGTEAFGDIEPLGVDEKNLNLLREADHIATEAVKKAGLEREISQMPVILFPGPGKPWIAIRPIKTEDFMTASPLEIGKEFPIKCLDEIADKISQLEIDGLVYDVTDKPPATIEWE